MSNDSSYNLCIVKYDNIHREWKEKWDMVDDDVADTVEYDMKNTFIFRPDQTLPLTGREVITIPHPLVMVNGLLFINFHL